MNELAKTKKDQRTRNAPTYSKKHMKLAAKTKMEAMSLQSSRTVDYLTFEVEKSFM